MIKALIIDDEEDARESLRLLIHKFCPEVSLLAICAGSQEGLAAIKAHRPDLVFLDVQMPYMSGFDLLGAVDELDFQTIFVTAHDKYAIKAIRFSALDYLLKPVDVEELVAAVNRVSEHLSEQSLASDYHSILTNVRNRLGQKGKLAVPTAEGMDFIDIRDIVYCEAEGSYTRLYLDGGSPMLVSKGLKDFEQILDAQFYCRVHHSFLVNLGHVAKYVKGEGGYVIMGNGAHVDVSRRRKEEFMRLIARL